MFWNVPWTQPAEWENPADLTSVHVNCGEGFSLPNLMGFLPVYFSLYEQRAQNSNSVSGGFCLCLTAGHFKSHFSISYSHPFGQPGIHHLLQEGGQSVRHVLHSIHQRCGSHNCTGIIWTLVSSTLVCVAYRNTTHSPSRWEEPWIELFPLILNPIKDSSSTSWYWLDVLIFFRVSSDGTNPRAGIDTQCSTDYLSVSVEKFRFWHIVVVVVTYVLLPLDFHVARSTTGL